MSDVKVWGTHTERPTHCYYSHERLGANVIWLTVGGVDVMGVNAGHEGKIDLGELEKVCPSNAKAIIKDAHKQANKAKVEGD